MVYTPHSGAAAVHSSAARRSSASPEHLAAQLRGRGRGSRDVQCRWLGLAGRAAAAARAAAHRRAAAVAIAVAVAGGRGSGSPGGRMHGSRWRRGDCSSANRRHSPTARAVLRRENRGGWRRAGLKPAGGGQGSGLKGVKGSGLVQGLSHSSGLQVKGSRFRVRGAGFKDSSQRLMISGWRITACSGRGGVCRVRRVRGRWAGRLERSIPLGSTLTFLFL